MYTVTVGGFKTKEEVLKFVECLKSMDVDDLPFLLPTDIFRKEKSVFEVNLNKKNFDLEVESL